MVRSFIRIVVVLAVAAGAVYWLVTQPKTIAASALPAHTPDLANGEVAFNAGGCSSCHAVPGQEDRLKLGGGLPIGSPFGTFYAPNISPDQADGIGGWSEADFVTAMVKGTAPNGTHYYPAFPYASYARMRIADIADLYAFMRTLPEVAGSAPPHEVGFPFSIRRGLGLWKRLFLNDAAVIVTDNPTELVVRGQYLVEGPGHCSECHTPRNMLGGLDMNQWMAGAASLETGGRPVPNVTSGEGGIGDWSADDIATLLESGFTPDFDSVGGSMASVVHNMARLPASDREAIAAYLKAIPGHPNGY